MDVPVVVGFVCRWVEDGIDERIRALEKNGTRIFQLNCIGSVTSNMVLNIFSMGVDMVFLLSCTNGYCKYYEGDSKIERIRNGLEALLEDMGLEKERIFLSHAKEFEEDPLGRVASESIAKVKDIGPNPYRDEG